MQLFEEIKKLWWDFPLLPLKEKEKIFYFIRGFVRGEKAKKASSDVSVYKRFAEERLAQQKLDNAFSIDYPKSPRVVLQEGDPRLIAFYLPQYYPDPHNDAWWGKGSTEWTNTTKTTAQYIGQYQPRLPGELGFYDLRVQENIYRQIELARFYGVYGFCFYYYWYDGERLLDLPLDNFVNDKTIDFPFSLCWCNEDWTRQWSSSNDSTLIAQSKTEESYRAFIHSCLPYLAKRNYIRINGHPILTIYKPDYIPNVKETIRYWKDVVREVLGEELFVIATISLPRHYEEDFLSEGFDAASEFSPGPHLFAMRQSTQEKEYVCETFQGRIYDYAQFIKEKAYFKHTTKNLFRAVSPMFDNTARKGNRAMVLDGATPELYKTWLLDAIKEISERNNPEERIVFINAWNEWAEGEYLEPDLKWHYGYLEATADAVIESRSTLNPKNFMGGHIS